ncbi:MAG TPA: hypothetical protein VIT91_10775 [Chthoniobacterales bacterium]
MIQSLGRMTPLVNSSVYRFALWGVLVASGLLIVWQAFAFFTGRISDHVLPLVRLLSGSQESVPVTYAWTMRLGLLSVAAFLGAGFLLGWLHFTRKKVTS